MHSQWPLDCSHADEGVVRQTKSAICKSASCAGSLSPNRGEVPPEFPAENPKMSASGLNTLNTP